MELSNVWLHVDNHYLNMAHALIVDDDATSTPPAVSVVFAGDVRRTMAGESRLAVLAWLERQVGMAQGGVVNVKQHYVVGEQRRPATTMREAVDVLIHGEGA